MVLAVLIKRPSTKQFFLDSMYGIIIWIWWYEMFFWGTWGNIPPKSRVKEGLTKRNPMVFINPQWVLICGGILWGGWLISHKKKEHMLTGVWVICTAICKIFQRCIYSKSCFSHVNPLKEGQFPPKKIHLHPRKIATFQTLPIELEST